MFFHPLSVVSITGLRRIPSARPETYGGRLLPYLASYFSLSFSAYCPAHGSPYSTYSSPDASLGVPLSFIREFRLLSSTFSEGECSQTESSRHSLSATRLLSSPAHRIPSRAYAAGSGYASA